jgi:hypothetical protein
MFLIFEVRNKIYAIFKFVVCEENHVVDSYIITVPLDAMFRLTSKYFPLHFCTGQHKDLMDIKPQENTEDTFYSKSPHQE